MFTPPTLGVILAGGLSRRMGGGDKTLLRLGGRTLLARIVEQLAPQCAAGLILSANGDPSRFAGFPGPIVPDGVGGNPGPLAGILAALDFAADASRPASSHPRPHPEVPRGDPEEGLQDPQRDLEGSFEARLRLVPQDEGEGERHEGAAATVITHIVSVSGDAPFLPSDLVGRLHAGLDQDGSRIALATSNGRDHYATALWPVSLRHALREALVVRDERRVAAFVARHGFVAVEWPTDPVDPFLNVNKPEDLTAAEAALAGAGS